MRRPALPPWLALAALLPLSGCVGFFRWVDRVLLPEEPTEEQPPGSGRDPDSGGGDSGWWEDRGR